MARRHRVAAIIENLAHQQGAALRLAIGGAVQFVGEPRLHGVEQPDIDNRLMLGRPGTAVVIEFAEIVAVLQNVGQRPIGQRDRADDLAAGKTALARDDALPAQLPLQSRDRAWR